MDEKWHRRELIEQELRDYVSPALKFDPESYRYWHQGELFTGRTVLRYPDGSLHSFLQHVDGLAHGISVLWFPNGQLQRYMEMEDDACHGLRIEWSEDGTLISEERYCRGRLVK